MALLDDLRAVYAPTRPTDPSREAFGTMLAAIEDYLARVEAAKARATETPDERQASIAECEGLIEEGVLHLIAAVRAFDPRGPLQ